ncbi:MAG TPA: COX15/CtaA family protein [Acidimicrobiales bacterium]|nr:COX15/CtaA family protein [Acidimicrobiales bacterium]
MTPDRRRSVSTPAFRWFAFASFLSMIIIVLTGAAVRLTGSGLGCPDWPTCFHHRITGSWSIHPFIEYANRIVTIALVLVAGATFIAALLRQVRRRDLVVLSGMLILGVVADAILGAFVVYSKLNPWLVSLHMMLSLSMVVLGAVLYHRSKYVYGPGARADVRDPHFRLIARLLWLPFVALLISGTMTTGSGPHAGSFQGQLVARRLPFALSSAAWVHSIAAVLFIGLVTGLIFAIWNSSAPQALQFGVRRLVVISLIQAAIGLTQYLTHLPPLLVELHVAGAVSLSIGVTQFHLRQTAHDREPGTKKSIEEKKSVVAVA